MCALAKWQCAINTHIHTHSEIDRERVNSIQSHRNISAKMCCICYLSVFSGIMRAGFGYYTHLIIVYCSIKCVVCVLGIWNIHMCVCVSVCARLASMSIDGRQLILCHFFAHLRFACIFIDSAFSDCSEVFFFFIFSRFSSLVHFVRSSIIFVLFLAIPGKKKNHRMFVCVCVIFMFFAETHMFH